MSALWLFLKGVAMGAANVIPGVSGGTIAFITGIYEPFIHSLKSFDAQALKLLVRFKFRKFSEHVNLSFLITLAIGIVFSLLSLGKLLDYLFVHYPVLIWSFFFGLIAISILSVGRSIKNWSLPSYVGLFFGTAMAVSLAFISPANENSSFMYLVICGIVAIASMILPGLSGSFVLILLGNYQLVMLRAIPSLNMEVIIPVGIGCIIGFIVLSRIIDFMLKKFHDPTISSLTGFILGSLLIIWPWKENQYLLDNVGNQILKQGNPIVVGYDWFIPELTPDTWLAMGMVLLGMGLVILIEKLAKINQ